MQSLHSISMSQRTIDFRMRSDLLWNGEFVESAPVKNDTYTSIESFERSQRMIDMFVDEHTVQSILAAAHFAGHLKRVFFFNNFRFKLLDSLYKFSF